jgi:chaperonin cofactor prefoldin
MTPSLEVQVADHAARIKNLEDQQSGLDAKLDTLRNWIMGTLGAALLGVLIQLVRYAK